MIEIATVIVLIVVCNLVWNLGQALGRWLDKHNNGLSRNRPEARWLKDLPPADPRKTHLVPDWPDREKKKLPEKWLQFEAELFARPSESDRKKPK